MVCSQCGAKIDEGGAFCPMCGAAAAESPPPPPPPVQQPTPPPPAAQPPRPTEPMPAVVAPAAPIVSGTDGATYPKAPLGARLLALIADSIIAAAPLPLGVLLLLAATAQGDPPVAGIVILGIAIVWQLAYSLGRDAAGGAGFGKRLTGLVVVTEAGGTPAPPGPAIVRQVVLWALGLIPAIGSLIEPIMVLVDKDGRRIGDKAAKTRVARSADVAAAGVPVPTAKGLAIAALVIALLVSVVGAAVGGVMLAGAAAGDTEWSTGVGTPGAGDPDPPPEPPVTGTPGGTPAAPAPDPEPEPVPEPSGEVVDADTATAAVTNLLEAWRNGDGEGSRVFATREFQEEFDGHFDYPPGDALQSFQVNDVYKDTAIWAVVVDEQWISGPERITYWVVEEDGTARVNYMGWEDDL